MSVEYQDYIRYFIEYDSRPSYMSFSGSESAQFQQGIAYLEDAITKYLSVQWRWQSDPVLGDSYAALYELGDHQEIPGKKRVADYKGIRRRDRGYSLMHLNNRGVESHRGVFNRFEDALKIFMAEVVNEYRPGCVSWMWRGIAGPEVECTLITDLGLDWNDTRFELRDSPEAWFIYDTKDGPALSHCLTMSFKDWVDIICQYPPVTVEDVIRPRLGKIMPVSPEDSPDSV